MKILILVSNCRKRWRKIQTNFLKIQRPIIGSGLFATHKKNSYEYLQDHLHFLNIYVEEKKITDINYPEYQCALDKKVFSPIQELLEEITVHNFTEFQTSGNTKRSIEEVDDDILQTNGTRKKKLKIDENIIVISDSESEDCSSIKESLEESEKSKKSKTNCVSDITFLKSLIKYIKLMNDSQKRKLKRKFIKVIDKILEENNSENDSKSIWNMTSSPSSSTTREMDVYQKHIFKNKVNSITKPPTTSPLLSSELNNVNNIEEHYWLCNLSE